MPVPRSPDFDALLGRLRAQFVLTPTDCLRLQRTAAILVSRGIGLQSRDALPWLAPVVCRSAAEQQHFYDSFGQAPPPAGDSGPGGHGSGDLADTGEGEAVVPPEDSVARRVVRLFLYLLLAAFLVGLALRFIGREPEAIDNAYTEIPPNYGPLPTGYPPPLPLPPPAPVATMGSRELAIRIAIALAMLAAPYARWRALLRRSRLRLKAKPAPDTSLAEQAALANVLPNLFATPSFRHGLGALRRHQSIESTRLHVGRTIHATIRTGGRPVLRYGMRPRTPEYVLLADRESPQDHLPLLTGILTQRMAEEKINATYYEYYVDPRRLQRLAPDPDSTVRRIADLAPSHPGARVIMLAERHHCTDRHARPSDWFQYFTSFDGLALLDPGKAGARPETLPLMDEATLLAVPATPSGVLSYARSLSGSSRDERHQSPAAEAPDLPRLLEARRDLYLDDQPPSPAIVEALVRSLAEWLEPRGIRLLRMTALFPMVDAGLTGFLGSRTSPPILDETVLLRISRLPWFRTGIYPQWLRLALVKGLSPEDLRFGVDHIHAYLSAPDGDLDGALRRVAGEQARSELVAWLRVNKGSEFHDPILIDAMDGMPPEGLGEDPVGGARAPLFPGDRFSRWLAYFWVGLAALSLLYALILPGLWLVRPGFEFMAPADIGNEAGVDVNAANDPGGNVETPFPGGESAENALDAVGDAAANAAADLEEDADNETVSSNQQAAFQRALDELRLSERRRRLLALQEERGLTPAGEGPLAPEAGEGCRPGSTVDALTRSCGQGDRTPDSAVERPPVATGQTASIPGTLPVNVRLEPTRASRVVIRLQPGETFTIIGETRDWWRVRLKNGREGYITKGYVNIVGPASATGMGQSTDESSDQRPPAGGTPARVSPGGSETFPGEEASGWPPDTNQIPIENLRQFSSSLNQFLAMNKAEPGTSEAPIDVIIWVRPSRALGPARLAAGAADTARQLLRRWGFSSRVKVKQEIQTNESAPMVAYSISWGM